MDSIEQQVHELYWDRGMNCARTMLICLGKLFKVEYTAQALDSAVGLHGAGGFRAQCGLVEGGLMFLGIYYSQLGRDEETIISACFNYAKEFNLKFGSLECSDLRPNGFTENDPPHMCEKLTCDAISFAYNFIGNENSV